MRLFRIVFTLALAAMVFASACQRGPQDPPPIPPALQEDLSAWLKVHGQAPEAYVLGLFSDRDVVFLGEQHRIKHHVVFVQDLIEPLYEIGVRRLATEFGRREDQALIDSLLGTSAWDEALAREIVFRQYVWWGYREYLDIYRAAWELNRKIPGDAPPFRILGLNDSPDWSHVETRADLDDGEVMRRVWGVTAELHWKDPILEAVDDGEKVLVHCGIHHAISRYRQPIVADGVFSHMDPNLRCGNHVYEAIGERAMTVFLHAPWAGPEGYGSQVRHPADGIIDALMLAIGPHPRGWSLSSGPFGELPIENAVYRHGYDDFRLADFCDGWIYFKPISEYEGVTPIEGWIHDGNLTYARAQTPYPKYRTATADQINGEMARLSELQRRWKHLR